MNNLMIFEGHEVEVLEVEGQVLFNPYHVGECLGLSDSAVRMAISKMTEAQVIKLKNSDVNKTDSRENSDVHNLHIRKLNNAGENFLTESGVYKLVFKSHKPNAEKFTDWIADEVLPSIRKHGIYATDNVIDNILNNPDFGIELLTRLKSERAARIAAEEEKERLQEELDYSKDWYSIKRVAAMNGVEWKKFKWRRLKEKSIELGYGVKKIFDANYGEVNTYHRDVWEAVYPEYEI
jgi:prophage antirepressor-like protein